MNAPEKQESKSTSPDAGRRPCFGDPERVCPRDEDEFIQPRAECVACGFLRSCLQQALRVQGLIGRESAPAPAVSRVSGFLRRWSERKSAATDSRDQDRQR